MLGGQIRIAALFEKNELVQKKLVVSIALLAEQRTPHAHQRFTFDVPQETEQFLPNTAEDVFFCDLECRYRLAIYQRLLLAHALVALQRFAAALQGFGILRTQLGAQKFYDGSASQLIYCRIVFRLCPIER